MRERPDLADDVVFFENQTIRTVVLRAWPDDDFLYRVFLRLNTGSVKLAPQELRQALIPGPFVQFVERRSADSSAIRRALNLRQPDFRMRDAELLVRYYAFAAFLPRYTGNLKAFLDEACSSLNKAWPEREERIRRAADRCDFAIDATYDVFGADAFRRWNGSAYEGRFNRAVFDVMVFYFRHTEVAEAARGNAADVVAAYKRLSEDDVQFVEAVQSTTKTVTATYRRLEKWGRQLSEATGQRLRVPELGEDNRIKLPE